MEIKAQIAAIAQSKKGEEDTAKEVSIVTEEDIAQIVAAKSILFTAFYFRRFPKCAV